MEPSLFSYLSWTICCNFKYVQNIIHNWVCLFINVYHRNKVLWYNKEKSTFIWKVLGPFSAREWLSIVKIFQALPNLSDIMPACSALGKHCQAVQRLCVWCCHTYRHMEWENNNDKPKTRATAVRFNSHLCDAIMPAWN